LILVNFASTLAGRLMTVLNSAFNLVRKMVISDSINLALVTLDHDKSLANGRYQSQIDTDLFQD